MNLLKKILLAAVVTIAPSLTHAFSPVRYVQISTNTLTQQTGAFNVATGTMTGASFSTATFNGNTIQATAGTRTFTVPNTGANASFVMTEGTYTNDNSTGTHTGTHTFNTIAVTTITPTNIVGVTNASSANAGNVGEYLTASLARSVGRLAANGVSQSVSTRTLTAGDWNVSFCGGFKGGGSTTSDLIVSISTTSNTQPPIDNTANPDSIGQMRLESTQNIAGNDADLCSDVIQVNISGSSTYYLVETVSFSAGTVTLYGSIAARRVR